MSAAYTLLGDQPMNDLTVYTREHLLREARTAVRSKAKLDYPKYGADCTGYSIELQGPGYPKPYIAVVLIAHGVPKNRFGGHSADLKFDIRLNI